jgi:hypothetical protein
VVVGDGEEMGDVSPVTELDGKGDPVVVVPGAVPGVVELPGCGKLDVSGLPEDSGVLRDAGGVDSGVVVDRGAELEVSLPVGIPDEG